MVQKRNMTVKPAERAESALQLRATCAGVGANQEKMWARSW